MNKNKINTNNKDGFLLPNSYFENFQHNVLEQINAEKTDDKHRDLGFEIPENYHKNNKQNLITTLEFKDNTVVPLLSKKIKYTFYAVAASFLLFFIFLNINKNSVPTTNIVSTTIDTTNVIKQKIREQFKITEKDVKMLALFVDDEEIDEYLDELLIEDLAFEQQE